MRVLRVYHGGRDPSHRCRERALAEGGVDITLAVPATWPEIGAEERLTAEDFTVAELQTTRPGDVNRHHHRDDGDVERLLSHYRPDVLDLHEEPFSAVARQWLRIAPPGLPTVCYSAQNIDKRWPPPFVQWERKALTRLKAVYPCSVQAASVLRGKGFAGLLDVLPLGIDQGLMTRGGQQHDDPVWTLLFVGRLVPEKGVQDAVRVLADLLQVRPAHLIIVGTGTEGPMALKLAAELNVAEHVQLNSWADAQNLAAFYQRAHVTLVPSRATRTWAEQFGRVIVEAQACGSVVAGYASGSIPEVGSRSVLLAAEGDAAALARHVEDLSRDRIRFESLQAAGCDRARLFSWRQIAQRQAVLYDRVLRGATEVVRADRQSALAEFGPPADVPGGGRPFALPLLREDNWATRTLARAVDLAAQGAGRTTRHS